MKSLYFILCVALVAVSIHAKITHSELAENKAKGLRLISLEDGVDPVWKTEDERLNLARDRINFVGLRMPLFPTLLDFRHVQFDVTEVYDPDSLPAHLEKASKAGPYRPPTHQTEVNAIIANLSLSNIKSHVDTLTKFHNRYVNEPGGVAASDWVLKTVQGIVSKYPDSHATVEPFYHSWNQTSVIARVPGAIEGPITIVGAHLDSFDTENSSNRAPGADGDATGCSALFEALRVLLAGGFKPSRPVEFHWYSAQFIGNIGSLHIAKSYKDSGKEVKAMMNIDGTA
ncbi:hypothetical protein H0H87_000367 [Tephrocybe sp. NHM501043]|nr:hypothetical protein H0H87_000367 [Tephrocybe sp. NHM501043]